MIMVLKKVRQLCTCILLMWAKFALADSVLNLHIVSVILGGNPAYEYGITAPAYDIAFEDANVSFPALFSGTMRETVFRVGRSKTCDDEVQLLYSALGEIFQLLSRLEGPTIVQTSGCTEMAVILGDLTREMGMPLIISVAGGEVFMNMRRFPYVLGFGPADHAALADAGIAMLDMYNWTRVSVLCGSRYQFAKPFDVVACQTLLKRLRRMNDKYRVSLVEFDPDKVDMYDGILQKVQLQSRIVFLFFDLIFLRPMMLAASARNMTEGAYLFLSAQSSVFPSQLRRPWGKNDSNDPKTLTALRSLVIYANVAPNWTRQTDVIRRIAARAASHYATNISSNFVNALNMAAYDGFLSLAEVLHSLNAKARERLSEHANSIIPYFHDKTFTHLSGKIYINSVGYRRVNVQFRRLNNNSGTYEAAWLFDVASGLITKQSRIADVWVWDSGPPKNVPDCGFRQEFCQDVRESTVVIVAKALGYAALPLCLGVLVTIGCIRRRGLLTMIGTDWRLDPSSLRFPTNQLSAYSFQFTFSHIDIFKTADEIEGMQAERLPGSPQSPTYGWPNFSYTFTKHS